MGIPEAVGAILGVNYHATMHRETLCGLSRYLCDNYGSVWYALSLMFTYSAPVVPKASTTNAAWNKLADAYWDDWAINRCDFFNASDFATLSKLASIHIDMDGDLGVVMDGREGIPQLRFVPSWRIGSRYQTLPAADNIVDGVQLDSLGRVIGYQVREGKNETRIYDRNQMVMLVERDRMERFRGLPGIRRGANDIRDANDIMRYEKLATKIESAIAAVIEGSPVLEKDWNDPDSPSPGMGGVTTPPSMTMAQLLGGEIPIIDGAFKQLTSNRPGTNKVEFIETLAGMFVSGLGIPPAFYLDMKLTGPNQRAVIGKAQRRFDDRKSELAKLARFSWVRVIGDAISKGELDPEDGWQRARTQGPPVITIDLGDQAKADQEAVQSGLMSLQTFFSKNSQDWEDQTEQVAAEMEHRIERLKKVSEKTGVSLDVLMKAAGFEGGGSSSAAPTGKPNPEDKKTTGKPQNP
jgi:capsid protein